MSKVKKNSVCFLNFCLTIIYHYITRSNCITNSDLTLLTYTLLFRLIVCSKRNFMTYQCVFKYLQSFNNKLIHSIFSGIIKRFTCMKACLVYIYPHYFLTART